MKEKRLRERFETTHEVGIERHGGKWLQANEAAILGAQEAGLDHTDPVNKLALSRAVLRVLDHLAVNEHMKWRDGYVPKYAPTQN